MPKQTPAQPKSKPLSNWGNTPGQKDQYGNNLWKSGDEYPPMGTRDPSGSGAGRAGVGIGAPAFGPLEVENPYGGDWIETGTRWCDTCGMALSVNEIATPAHIGHNVRYGDDKTNYDINNVGRIGGEYRVEWPTDRNPMAAAPDPMQSVNPPLPQEMEVTGENAYADSWPVGANQLEGNRRAVMVPDYKIKNPSSDRPYNREIDNPGYDNPGAIGNGAWPVGRPSRLKDNT